jgi:hypothetical protein
LALLSLLMVFAACGAGGDNYAPERNMLGITARSAESAPQAPRPPAAMAPMADAIYATTAAGLSGWSELGEAMPISEPMRDDALLDTGRKIIFNYDYQLETKDMQATLDTIEVAVRAAGGFVSFSNQSGRDDEGQFWFAHMTLRIPTRNAGFFEHAVELSGHVRSKNTSGRDVTDEYFDIEARLRTLSTQESRLLELLRQSGDLSDLLQIERELTRVRTEIERLTGSLRRFDDLVDLATFSLYIHSVRDFTPPVTTSFGTRLWQSTTGSLRGVLNFFQETLIVLVYALPYLILFGLIAFVIVKICLRRRKKRIQAMQQFYAASKKEGKEEDEQT